MFDLMDADKSSYQMCSRVAGLPYDSKENYYRHFPGIQVIYGSKTALVDTSMTAGTVGSFLLYRIQVTCLHKI